MKKIDIIAVILLIIGGLNWGILGLANINVIDQLFSHMYVVARLIYILVGLSALWNVFQWKKVCKRCK